MDLYDAFPDSWWEIEDLLAEDGLVLVRDTIRGTYEGKLATFDLDPTRETFRVGGIGSYQFQDDRIIEAWLLVDAVELLGQLGVLSASDTPVSAGTGRQWVRSGYVASGGSESHCSPPERVFTD